MTQIFAGRAELMPAGETTEQHENWQKEEADLVEEDRSSPRGLFKGHFSLGGRRAWGPYIRDNQDGVNRCPRCAWELEGGSCGSCGWGADDNQEMTIGDFDEDFDEYFSDGDDMWSPQPPGFDVAPRHLGGAEDILYLHSSGTVSRRSSQASGDLSNDESLSEESEEHESDSMDGFIVNDVEGSSRAQGSVLGSESGVTHHNPTPYHGDSEAPDDLVYRLRTRARNVPGNNDDDTDVPVPAPTRLAHRRPAIPISSSSEDNADPPFAVYRRRRQFQESRRQLQETGTTTVQPQSHSRRHVGNRSRAQQITSSSRVAGAAPNATDYQSHIEIESDSVIGSDSDGPIGPQRSNRRSRNDHRNFSDDYAAPEDVHYPLLAEHEGSIGGGSGTMTAERQSRNSSLSPIPPFGSNRSTISPLIGSRFSPPALSPTPEIQRPSSGGMMTAEDRSSHSPLLPPSPIPQPRTTRQPLSQSSGGSAPFSPILIESSPARSNSEANTHSQRSRSALPNFEPPSPSRITNPFRPETSTSANHGAHTSPRVRTRGLRVPARQRGSNRDRHRNLNVPVDIALNHARRYFTPATMSSARNSRSPAVAAPQEQSVEEREERQNRERLAAFSRAERRRHKAERRAERAGRASAVGRVAA